MLQATCVVLLITCLVTAVILICLVILLPNKNDCKPTITTASGSSAKTVCSGSLIFMENFETLDKEIWQPEVTLNGGNDRFEWCVADDENSFEENGRLNLKPTLTANKIGRYETENGYVHLNDCTDSNEANCERQAGGNIIINPVRSSRLSTANSFSFKYGRAEVIAKIPRGDWLLPAVLLLPCQRKYGEWPRSGEIDLLEARGNLNYTDKNGVQIGVQQVTASLHFGPDQNQDGYQRAVFSKTNANGFDSDFHKYSFVWNESGIRLLVDDIETGFVPANGGFRERGGFNDDIWSSGSMMAPFDQEFYFVISLGVGLSTGQSNKPWNDTSFVTMKDFWINRNQWMPTWNFVNDDSSFIIDSVKVWAI